MTTPHVIGWLRRLPSPDCTPDGELARRYHASGDQAAFELLVRRYAPLVFRICRSVVRDPHLAEDAAQAVFVILARKAGTVVGLRSVAGWLARVSYRTANRARRRDTADPLPAGLADDHNPAAVAAAREVAAVVADEVARLPARYRDPVALCYYDGLTNAAAATRLGWPPGTVAGRLARARRLLRGRLERRGVTFPVVTAAAVPAGFTDRVLASAPSPAVSALASEVLSAMSPLSRRVLVACGMSLLAAAAGLSARPADPPKPVIPDPVRAGFVIEGTVTDATGRTPMTGVTVEVEQWNRVERKRTAEATTGADGRYRLSFGPAELKNNAPVLDVAIVRAGKPGWYGYATTSSEDLLSGDRDRKPGWYSWYWSWPNRFVCWEKLPESGYQPEVGHLNLLRGAPGKLDFRMAPAAAVTVRLTDGAGKPMADKVVGLMRERGNAAPGVIASGNTDAAGVWTATEVPCWPCQLVLGHLEYKNAMLQYGTAIGSINFREAAEYTAEVTLAGWTNHRSTTDVTDVRVQTTVGRKLSP